MLFILMLTGRCNLSCRYCGGSIDESVMPAEITYDISQLIDFLNSWKDVSVAFYGGEPLLKAELVRRIMDEVNAKHFIIQTNGLLLRRLGEEYVKRFSTVLVSIDGRKEVTEHYRGRIYERVLENVRWVREFFDGELIARMTASQRTEIFADVLHLLELDLFTHVHWQIDAVWSAEGIWRDFEGWIEDYKTGITKLARLFEEEMAHGRVLGIVPFLGVLSAMIFDKNPSPPCGSGSESFAITTDGRIVACPVVADLPWNTAGNLEDGIVRRVEVVEPCPSCEHFHICGGRCLFSNRERLWGERGFRMLCDATRHLIWEMERVKERAISLAETGVIDLDQLRYPRFLNTTEIIP
ncbi:putative peptide-modifying radical SAM enzyme, AF0577 family [Geoglobus ahangari]|uniref:Putative peptide-modifying radical SAM enzyme, AF0577 family n=1 Tax=Geoglobus ahangari TaxID=113653 RepID=A0A0F7DBB1_9EURY|nr:TIGR04084 family radical SAM/SPASM domain-containing protein [Geoglobus ahangari]AKG90781.1 putative peptide-modifying radical SAM enzyme, AF0577 family [Geoglobus ahangari]